MTYKKIIEKKDFFLSKDNNTSLVDDIRKDYNILSILVILNLTFQIVLWIGWPIHLGSDTRSYISFYINAFEADSPSYYNLIASRQPVPPIFHAVTLILCKNINIVAQTILSTTCILMVYLIAKPWGRISSITSSILLIIYLPFQLFFHKVSSEGLFSWSFILIILSLRYSLQTKDKKYFFLLGISIAINILTRPSGTIFIILPFAIIFLKLNAKKKFILMSTAYLAIIIFILPWLLFKGIKFDIWGLSRAPAGSLLFACAYKNVKNIKADNGLNSNYLEKLIKTKIVPNERYKNNNITITQILHNPDTWIYYNDISYIIDMELGWDRSKDFFNRVAYETFFNNPYYFLKKTIKTVLIATIKPAIKYYYFIPNNEKIYEIPPRDDNNPPIYSWYSSRKKNHPAANKEYTKYITKRENIILKPLMESIGNKNIAGNIIKFWELIWPNQILFYLLIVFSLAFNKNNSSIFLLVSNGSAFGYFIIHFLASPEVRYRMVVEPIIIITASIGFYLIINSITQYIKHRKNINIKFNTPVSIKKAIDARR